MAKDKRPGASTARDEKAFPSTAWAQTGLHVHSDNPGAAMGWYECRCDEGELLRPQWAWCRELGCPEGFHLHQPPKGSIYPPPPERYDVRRIML